jgi:3-oxoacyl-[acyl-carrier protein] reductase
MDPWINLGGKVALVTGSSRGIGAGIVRALDRHGARCIVNYVADADGRNESDARDVAAQLRDPLIIECDVGNEKQVAAMMQRIAAERGGLDILVNNAGILRDRSLKKITADEWESVLRVNLTGVFNCIHHAQPILRDDGRVVNLSSLAAQMGFFGQSNYAASKAGVLGLTRVAARELAKQRITVNAIAPGVIDTEMTRGIPEEIAKQYLQQIPLGRVGTLEDIANTVLFLVSSAAGYITGQVIHVNGGFYMG